MSTDGTGLIQRDPWLAPYADDLRRRRRLLDERRAAIAVADGSLLNFARGHEYFGLHAGERDGRSGVWYREWAPAAKSLFLIGDFNDWDRVAHPMVVDKFGVWSIFVSTARGAERLVHGSRVKVHVNTARGPMDRIPAYIRRVVFDERTHDPAGVYWAPPPFAWQHQPPVLAAPLHIYEAHPGMALEAPRVGAWSEFQEQVLPRIVQAGYNAIQLMAVQEHPYYASFGYHVSNLFAPSSRFGTAEDLKRLIDAAHGAGLLVIMDIVHSHMVKNVHDGLNRFDGTDFQYFHAGPRGEHIAWDSLLWDYGKWEVLRLLLSNVRYWLEEYRFDGLRFDGVGSMMYTHHGLGKGSWSYDDYFRNELDEPAITYLQLANELAHELNPRAVTIAEDVSGMAGLARPLAEGGLGFDYRLAMGLPDFWVRYLKSRRDEDWSMAELFQTLTNRRRDERHVAYAESHDQALVGDKTIAFWLMDAEMYTQMRADSRSLVIDRGIALHKLIRLATFALGGEAWLSFIGNEFGHPEWIDFPRPGNSFSYQYARRQWSLVDNPDLRYARLAEFDRAMLALDDAHGLLAAEPIELLHLHEDQKILAARRGKLVLLLNFHAAVSYAEYRLGWPAGQSGTARLLLDTDEARFGGHGRIVAGQEYPLQPVPQHGHDASIQVYIPNRTALVLTAL